MTGLFGTSGARGKTNVDITPELAFRIAVTYGILLRKKTDDRAHVVVGHDQRYGADMLANATIAGFQSVGVDVTTLGRVSTGVYSVTLQAGEFDGGVLITGSHMPPERIGIIPTLSNGHYADRDITDIIEARLATPDISAHHVEFQKVGRVTPAMSGAHIRYVHQAYHGFSGREAVEAAHFSVLLDPGNGTCGEAASTLFSSFDCDVWLINRYPMPIPDRPSECNPETCVKAIAQMRKDNFHLGACFDGDADRVKFITPEGSMLSDDVVAALFALYGINQGDVYVTPVNASGLVCWAVKKNGGRLVECRIGQPSTDTAVRRYNAAMASESNAGKFGFREFECCYDGPYAVVRMLEIMARTGKSLAQLADELPEYHQAAIRIEVEEDHKVLIAGTAIQAMESCLLGEIERTDYTDGTKWFLSGERWLLLRPSGTEPVVRAYSDARSQEDADALVALAKSAFENALCQ